MGRRVNSAIIPVTPIRQRFVWIVVIASRLALSPAAQSPQPVPVRVWADKTTDVSGRVSRDGRILPFVDWTTYGLSVRDLTSGEVRALVPGKRPGYPMMPTPSHDGKQIAYLFERSLHIVPVAGGPSKVVYEHPQLAGIGDWTADGAALVVTKMADARKQEIGVVDIATGAYRRLAEARGASAFSTAASQPFVLYEQWTPDAPSRRELRMVSLKTGAVSVVLTGADDFSPAWSPKHDAVVFVSNRDDRRAVWSIAVRDGRAAGAPRLLHELHEDIWLIGLTTDGIAYFAGYGTPFVTYVARVTWPAGSVSDAAAIPTPRFLGARRPVFSPDGRRLATVFRAAYPGVRPGWQTPAITELATGPQWTFPSHLAIRDEVAWLPDGRSLIAINDEPGAGEGAGPPWTFWRLSMADRSITRVGRARDSGLVRLAGITGREIVYKRNVFSPLVSYIEAVDMETGSTRELYRTTEEITDASLSPDGKQLAITVRRANLTDVYLLRVGETTPSSPVLPNFRANARPQAMWLAGQDALILTGAVGNEQGIWIVPLNGNAPQRLRLDVEGLIEARLSPDGGMVAYTIQPPAGRELWMLRSVVPAARRAGSTR
jgi:Tol biopolymer transport system component